MGIIEGNFAVLMSLYHALELLLQHGMKCFYIFIKGLVHGNKSKCMFCLDMKVF